jgi:putative nucleotidyltransferase with HDIG domain
MKVEGRFDFRILGIVVAVSVISTLIMLPMNLVNIPSLKPGEISPVDIRSPYNIRIKDVEKTEELKEKARKKVLPVYSFREGAEEETLEKISSIGNLTSKEKRIVEEILKLYYRRGIADVVPQGYKKLEVKKGEETFRKSFKNIIKLEEVGKNLKQDLSQFTSKKRAKEISELVYPLVKPNYVFEKETTEELVKKAEEKVKPVYLVLKKGELLVKRGERVSKETARKIELLRSEHPRFKSLNKYVSLFLLSLAMFFLLLKLYKITSPSAYTFKNVVFSMSVVSLDIFLIKVLGELSKLVAETFNIPGSTHLFYVPVVSSVIFASMFITKKVAVIHSLPVATIPGLVYPKPELFIIPVIFGSVLSAFDSRKYRSRNLIYQSSAIMGISVGLMQEVVLVFSNGLKFVPEMIALPVLSLIGAGITAVVVNGLSPLFINIFKFTTDLVYMELINLNHPLLRKLILKAPGTYSHSVMTATLSEAAAEAIGANALLAKAGGLFHDIGKLKNPLAFAENQNNGVNIHDKIPPEKSVGILKSHVEYGEELARKYDLPQKVIDIIKQHHGTKLMKFFYHKAKQSGENVDERKFRYPGPKPQFKEAGIVMLADTVEAGVRSYKNKNGGNDIDRLIHNLIMEVVEDGQLNQSGLSLKDISVIEKVFKKVLSGIYHSRVEYPEEQEKK